MLLYECQQNPLIAYEYERIIVVLWKSFYMFRLHFTVFTKYTTPWKKTIPHIIECSFTSCVSMLMDMKNSAQLCF